MRYLLRMRYLLAPNSQNCRSAHSVRSGSSLPRERWDGDRAAERHLRVSMRASRWRLRLDLPGLRFRLLFRLQTHSPLNT